MAIFITKCHLGGQVQMPVAGKRRVPKTDHGQGNGHFDGTLPLPLPVIVSIFFFFISILIFVLFPNPIPVIMFIWVLVVVVKALKSDGHLGITVVQPHTEPLQVGKN